MAHDTIYRKGGEVKRAQATKASSEYTVDKEKFKDDIRAYQEKCKQYEAEGKDVPQIPDSIGLAIMQICAILAKKPYFINYSWIDEMQSDAIIKCCDSVRKFDVNAGTSAFAYFMQIAYYEFIGRINDEKKQKIVKASIVQNIGVFLEDIAVQESDAGEDFHNSMTEILQLQSVEIDYKERKQKEPVIQTCPFDLFDIENSEINLETLEDEDTVNQ